MSTTDTTCTCPSGDRSLRWPCPTHPPTQPAPAGAIDREAIAKAIEDRIKASPILPEVPGRIGQPLAATMHDLADAVLAVLPTRTVAQVKAEALREAATGFRDCDEWPYRASRPRATEEYLNARADELEREDKR